MSYFSVLPVIKKETLGLTYHNAFFFKEKKNNLGIKCFLFRSAVQFFW